MCLKSVSVSKSCCRVYTLRYRRLLGVIMRSYLVRPVLVLSVSLVSLTCVFSQADAKNGKPEELKIRRSVLITDRAGSVVPNVKPADLKIFEEGQEQQISD